MRVFSGCSAGRERPRKLRQAAAKSVLNPSSQMLFCGGDPNLETFCAHQVARRPRSYLSGGPASTLCHAQDVASFCCPGPCRPPRLSRELLSEAFWPGRSNEQARNSLRQALVDIGRAFPASSDATVYVDGDQETVVLIAGLDEADISIFDRKLEAGGTADLAFAADLYRGEVLAGESIPDGLDEWFGPYQSTYRRKALQLVERLSLMLSDPGSAEEPACEGLAERLLASDPTVEAAHRALMRIHILRGMRTQPYASSRLAGLS